MSADIRRGGVCAHRSDQRCLAPGRGLPHRPEFQRVFCCRSPCCAPRSCCVMAPRLPSVEVALLFGAVMDASNGLSQTVSGVIWAKYFGRLHLGSITGLVSTVLGRGPRRLARCRWEWRATSWAVTRPCCWCSPLSHSRCQLPICSSASRPNVSLWCRPAVACLLPAQWTHTEIDRPYAMMSVV